MPYNDMSVKDIVDNFKVLCESGLRTSALHQLRRAMRDLSRDMYKNPKRYKSPLDRGLVIETKSRPKVVREEPEPRPKKKKLPEEPIETEIKDIIE